MKLTINCKTENEFYSLMVYFESRGWVNWLNQKPTDYMSSYFPCEVFYENNFVLRGLPQEYEMISFSEFRKAHQFDIVTVRKISLTHRCIAELTKETIRFVRENGEQHHVHYLTGNDLIKLYDAYKTVY